MIDLTRLGKNMHELQLGDYRILFSYYMPVAFHDIKNYYTTSKFYSGTTTKHVNQWVGFALSTDLDHHEFMERIHRVIKEDE